jgi:hypothetical protein
MAFMLTEHHGRLKPDSLRKNPLCIGEYTVTESRMAVLCYLTAEAERVRTVSLIMGTDPTTPRRVVPELCGIAQ